MSDIKEVLVTLRVARQRIHIEIFNGSESITPGVVHAETRAPHLPNDDANTGPLVTFARSGIAAHWNASTYQSILELAEACDVPVRWSCRTGVCHKGCLRAASAAASRWILSEFREWNCRLRALEAANSVAASSFRPRP